MSIILFLSCSTLGWNDDSSEMFFLTLIVRLHGIMLPVNVVEGFLRVGMCLCEMFLGAPVLFSGAVDCTFCQQQELSLDFYCYIVLATRRLRSEKSGRPGTRILEFGVIVHFNWQAHFVPYSKSGARGGFVFENCVPRNILFA